MNQPAEPHITYTFAPGVSRLDKGRYAGLPIVEFGMEFDRKPGNRFPPADAAAWRLSCAGWRADIPDEAALFARFAETVDLTRVKAIIIGEWAQDSSDGPYEFTRLLVEHAPRLTALRSLFIGAVTYEFSEISWIVQDDLTPLLRAFPRLERLEVRGGERLGLDPLRHERLRILRVECGGLPGRVARAVAESDLPALEYLELWLGSGDYGWSGTAADLAGILSGERLPALRHLGIKNSEIQDEIAAAVASAPIVPRLETLDLSMGSLSDAGAEALLSGQPLTHLRRLNLRHHYLSEPMAERVRDAFAGTGVEVDLSDRQTADDGDWRFVEVGE
ncbi:STM4015 family protein [Thermostaphylospora chromogena]|uniref:Leucine Rich repeat-containing protein n=1 Tax=Thermostaphylospora chromogena TaxID=35622 RepID=A0A1H1GL19_9ACTN|nr:STM4015 family protein [Thermostaphylospora chromogena]SDR13885.1 hypothetical protein SAMN04489764_3662 [Thermostaphylospora chromogena]